MQRAQSKMLREYFSGVPVESLTKCYGYSESKIKSLASDYKAMKPYIDIAEKTKADAMKLIEDAWDW